MLIARKQWDKANTFFRKSLELSRGENSLNLDHQSFKYITKTKIKHDIEHFLYLSKIGIKTREMADLASLYTHLSNEIVWPATDSTPVALSETQQKLLKTSYNRPFHLVREIRQAAERRFRSKEEELQKELETVRGEINKMIRREDIQTGGELILKPEDRAKISKARERMVAIRKELRGVQHELRKDIDRLDSWLKFFNIAAIPLILALGTLLFTLTRRLRRRSGVVETG